MLHNLVNRIPRLSETGIFISFDFHSVIVYKRFGSGAHFSLNLCEGHHF